MSCVCVEQKQGSGASGREGSCASKEAKRAKRAREQPGGILLNVTFWPNADHLPDGSSSHF